MTPTQPLFPLLSASYTQTGLLQVHHDATLRPPPPGLQVELVSKLCRESRNTIRSDHSGARCETGGTRSAERQRAAGTAKAHKGSPAGSV